MVVVQKLFSALSKVSNLQHGPEASEVERLENFVSRNAKTLLKDFFSTLDKIDLDAQRVRPHVLKFWIKIRLQAKQILKLVSSHPERSIAVEFYWNCRPWWLVWRLLCLSLMGWVGIYNGVVVIVLPWTKARSDCIVELIRTGMQARR